MRTAAIAATLLFCAATAARADALADLDAAWKAYIRSDYPRAVTLYTRAIDSGELTGRHLPDAYHNRGQSYKALGRYEAAVADFDSIIDLNPYFPQVYISRGQTRRAQGKPKLAIEDFGKAIEINPESRAAYLHRASTFAAEGMYDAALEDQSRIISLAPNDPIGYATRCETYELVSKIREAIADCRKALSLDPGNVGARAALERMGVEP
ncbi:MAG: tetratricopeptide repeat protein [Alphaproteobacteria bacterium]|nr:tetratricopeptide repeat protein [Alphaproteobacteria bacterium]